MGREVRMVPPDWQHPKRADGSYIPMHDTSYEDAVKTWEEDDLPGWIEGKRLWSDGQVKRYDGSLTPIHELLVELRQREEPWRKVPENPDYVWWAGDRPRKPKPQQYMPDWPQEERTHFMMYEDTSEGTPISPAFATADDLAKWLAETGASAFAGDTATYSQWLAMIRRGSSMASAVIIGGEFMSGVAAVSRS